MGGGNCFAGPENDLEMSSHAERMAKSARADGIFGFVFETD